VGVAVILFQAQQAHQLVCPELRLREAAHFVSGYTLPVGQLWQRSGSDPCSTGTPASVSGVSHVRGDTLCQRKKLWNLTFSEKCYTTSVMDTETQIDSYIDRGVNSDRVVLWKGGTTTRTINAPSEDIY